MRYPGALHPLIRILCLLVLAAALPSLALTVLALVMAALLLVLMRSPGGLTRWRQGLWRLKWLFLALFVLYLGYTPGDPLITALPGLSAEGLHEAARRATILAILLAAVQALLAATSTPHLVEALRQLLRPLRRLGLEGDRFALRLALVLAQVGSMQARVAALRGSAGGPLAAAATLIADLERGPSDDEESVPVATRLAPPRILEFLLPLTLAAVMWGLG